MGKYAELQEAQKASKELKKLKKEMMAKYFCDLSKLTFTAMVLGGIISFFQDFTYVLFTKQSWFLYPMSNYFKLIGRKIQFINLFFFCGNIYAININF